MRIERKLSSVPGKFLNLVVEIENSLNQIVCVLNAVAAALIPMPREDGVRSNVVRAREPLLGISRGLAPEDGNLEARAAELELFAANVKGQVVRVRARRGFVELVNFLLNGFLEFLRG